MSSIFCAISYIKNVSGTRSRIETAVYRTAVDEFIENKFKDFCSNESSLVEDVLKTSISLIIGRFAVENEELHVRKILYFRKNKRKITKQLLIITIFFFVKGNNCTKCSFEHFDYW